MKKSRGGSNKMLLVAVGVIGLIFTYATTIGKNSVLGKHTSNFIAQVKSKAPSTNLKVGAPVTSFRKLMKNFRDPGIEDPSLEELRDACMEAMFLEKAGYHFTQSRWGATPMTYQFRGLEVSGPELRPPNAGDVQRGIDLRAGYRFHVMAYRTYDAKRGWSGWIFEQPPNLNDMSFSREAGRWKVSYAPTKSFSVR